MHGNDGQNWEKRLLELFVFFVSFPSISYLCVLIPITILMHIFIEIIRCVRVRVRRVCGPCFFCLNLSFRSMRYFTWIEIECAIQFVCELQWTDINACSSSKKQEDSIVLLYHTKRQQTILNWKITTQIIVIASCMLWKVLFLHRLLDSPSIMSRIK